MELDWEKARQPEWIKTKNFILYALLEEDAFICLVKSNNYSLSYFRIYLVSSHNDDVEHAIVPILNLYDLSSFAHLALCICVGRLVLLCLWGLELRNPLYLGSNSFVGTNLLDASCLFEGGLFSVRDKD